MMIASRFNRHIFIFMLLCVISIMYLIFNSDRLQRLHFANDEKLHNHLYTRESWNINYDVHPSRVIGHGNSNATYVFGIPHVHRYHQNYILNTLQSLIANIPQSQRYKVLFIISLSDSDPTYISSMIKLLLHKFNTDFQSGLLQIITPPQTFYPNFDNITMPSFFQGNRKKFIWTCKQNFDYAYLMLYCHKLGKYYIQMEDDVETHDMYFTWLEAALLKEDLSPNWFLIDLSTLGFIGKMFHSDDLMLVAQFLLSLNAHKPVDWLLDSLIPLLACSPEDSVKRCQMRQQELRYIHRPSLFQHVGVHSSLKDKIQPLKDFGYRPIFPG